MNAAIAKSADQMNEQELFLSILHHDAFKRNNYFVRFELDKSAKERKEDNYVRQVWHKDSSLPLCTYDNKQYDMYIAIHSFNKRARIGTKIFTYNAFYFDLDWHDSERMHELDERLENTLNALNKAYASEELPRPTMVTNTGRGLGLFYVLDRSIANTLKTGKQIKFFEYIRDQFGKKIDRMIVENESAGIKMLGMDWQVVRDRARVARLPLTHNLSAGTECYIHEINRINGEVVYYSLSDMVKFIPSYGIYEEADKEHRKNTTNQKIIDFDKYKKDNFLYQRIRKIERAQEVFKNQREGCRELLCFYFYNTAVQIYGEVEAMEMLETFHSRFTYPIYGSELLNIVRSVRKAEDKEGNIKGYYKISDYTIKENLKLEKRVASGEITQSQVDYMGFCDSVKTIQRRRIKEENQRKKEDRNRNIIQYIQEHPEAIYAQIADLFGVSERTINNIVKKYNVYRYASCQKQEDMTSICDAPEKEKLQEENANKNQPVVNITVKNVRKTKKNAPVSNDVMNYNKSTNNINLVSIEGKTSHHKKGEGEGVTTHQNKRRKVYSIGELCPRTGRTKSTDMLMIDKRVSVDEDGWVSMDCHALFDEPDWLYWLDMGFG